jgi:hypothetical protein
MNPTSIKCECGREIIWRESRNYCPECGRKLQWSSSDSGSKSENLPSAANNVGLPHSGQ